MRLASYSAMPAGRSARAATDGFLAARSVQFGDQVLVLCEDEDWTGVRQEAERRDIPLRDHAASIPKANLYLVIQKGRLFQRAHPEVELLLDKGRYLVAALDPQRAAAMQASREPCFTVRSLEPGERVFEVRATGGARVRSAAEPKTVALLERLTRDSLINTVRRLVSFPTRHSTSRGFRDASAWLADELTSLGYDCSLEPVPLPGSQGQSFNVMARRQGSGRAPRQLVLATAHLDSVNHEDGPDGIAPGADDNASGCAGLLELAKLLCSRPIASDLGLIFFGGEEQGLYGSTQFVRALSIADKARISAVVNMDMIGTKLVSPASVLIEAPSFSESIAEGLTRAAANYTSLRVETTKDYWGSDHVPFIESGIPAVLTIEGADQANEHEHTARDTIDRLDFDFLLEVARMNAGFLLEALRS